jgi:hypothetical protein
MSDRDEYLKAHNLTVRSVRYTNWLGEPIRGEVIVGEIKPGMTVTVKDLDHPDHLYHSIPVEDVVFADHVPGVGKLTTTLAENNPEYYAQTQTMEGSN